MLDVYLRTSLGDRFRLTGTPADSPVLSPYGDLETLRANVSRSDLAVPGGAGVLPGRRRFGAIQTELEFYLQAETGEELAEVYARLRRGWSRATWDNPCMVEIEGDHPLNTLTFDVVVDGALPGVQVDMSRRTQETLKVPVVCRDGLARTDVQTGRGSVTVTNAGDTLIYPRIVYEGAGGRVTSPSGAAFTLPGVSERTTIDLDPSRLRLDGAVSEGVPPGKSGTWELPDGARLEWWLMVADPWA